MDMMEIIEELESELCKKGIFGRKIDIVRCGELAGQLRTGVPVVISEAQNILNSRKQILDNADSVAKNTIKEAEERAGHIVENSELIKLANNEKQKIIDSGVRQCDELVERTKNHLDTMFKDIEQFLLATLAMIRSNREELRNAPIKVK